MSEFVAGVDSSTQGCKVVIADLKTGIAVRSGRALHPPGTEVHPDHWWVALQESIRSAGGLDDVKAIAVSGQQHGMVALDSKGNVVRPALLWNDVRSAPSAAALIAEAGGPEVYADRVGIVPVASFTASKLRWLRDAEPENATRVAAVALPHDWLTWRLRGYGPENPDLEALVSDRSDASGTAYWSGKTGEYDPALFELAFGRKMRVAGDLTSGQNSDAVIVPRVLAPDSRAGVTPDGIVVGPGTGDNAGGALGLCVVPGDVVVSIGTSGAVFSPKVESLGPGDPTGIVAGFEDATGIHLPLVCTLNGARILDSVAKVLSIAEGPNGLTPLALAAKPGSEGLVLLPYFESERTPNLPTAKATLHNMTLSNSTPANIARAYVEGLVCSMAQAINAINVESHNGSRRALLIGGAAANRAVQEIAAYVFDVDSIHIPTPGEYVARGAALQAAWVYTGARPHWPLPVDRKIPPHRIPGVLQQYELAQRKEYPQLYTA